MAVMADQPAAPTQLPARRSSVANVPTRRHRLPVAVRRRVARRRRLAITARNLVSIAGVAGLAAVLLTVTLLSLVGR